MEAGRAELLELAAVARESDLDLRDLVGDLAAAAALRAAAAVERAWREPEAEAEADAALARAERLARLLGSAEAAYAAAQARRGAGDAGMSDGSLRRARIMAGLAPADAEFDPVAEYGLTEPAGA